MDTQKEMNQYDADLTSLIFTGEFETITPDEMGWFVTITGIIVRHGKTWVKFTRENVCDRGRYHGDASEVRYAIENIFRENYLSRITDFRLKRTTGIND